MDNPGAAGTCIANLVMQIPTHHGSADVLGSCRMLCRQELAVIDILMSHHLPALHAHLHTAGMPAVLYASQWLMTGFTVPFPLHVGCRVLDVLLQSQSASVLPRLALALLEALQGELLSHKDLEGLITTFKVHAGGDAAYLHAGRRAHAAAPWQCRERFAAVCAAFRNPQRIAVLHHVPQLGFAAELESAAVAGSAEPRPQPRAAQRHHPVGCTRGSGRSAGSNARREASELCAR